MGLIVRQIEHGSADHQRSVQLRREILRVPLGLELSPEEILGERDEIVLVAEWDGDLVGTLNLVPVDAKTLKMRQVAVRPDSQRKGVGRALVLESEEVGRSMGFTRMELHARETAVDFYLSLGYEIEGETFEEVTIPHRAMFKTLISTSA